MTNEPYPQLLSVGKHLNDFMPVENSLYKNKSFLHKKYVVEGLSCEEISTQIFSARTTILKYLQIHGIPIREVGTNQRRARGLAYGQKIINCPRKMVLAP